MAVTARQRGPGRPAGAGRLRMMLAGLRHVRGNPLFDERWYLEQYADVAAAGTDAYRHYRRHGVHEGRDPNPLFDTDWYLDRYPDVRAAGVNPLDHYLDHGAADGRDPCPLFDTRWYAAQNADVVESGLNPLLHYLRQGGRQGWLPRPGGWVPRDLGWLGSYELSGERAGRPAAGRRRARVPDAQLVAWLREQAQLASGADQRVLLLDPDRASAPASAGLEVDVFPGARGNRRAGTGTALIAQLEVERSARAELMLLTPAGRDWAAQRPDFVAHLEDRYAALARDDELGELLDLRRVIGRDDVSLGARLRALARDFRRAAGREPAVLDWTAHGLARVTGGGRIFGPATGGDTLPYLDRSVDMVVVDRDSARDEARRVAAAALIVTTGPQAELKPRVEMLAFPERRQLPAASIIIPNFNGLPLLRACLRSIAETVTLGSGVEVIVVDDASDDGSAQAVEELVAAIVGARLIVNEANSGFIASVNRGAAAASGEFLVLLNNDTVVLPGWLDELLSTFELRPDAGVVGGRLVYPDGRLQEAGGMVFRDGSAAKLGAGDDDPDHAAYMYLRETDYVSGALLATRRQLFDQLGRFDPAYGFGFYEDTDFCFRARQAGLGVYYQPRSVVVHVEGASAGTDTAVGPKQHQVANQTRFSARWQAVLEGQPNRPSLERREDRLAVALNGSGRRARA